MAYVGIGNRQDYVADFQSQNFSGDGSTTAFTLNYEAVTGSIRVAVDNVLQPADGSSYTVDGFTLNFDTAPASGTNNITILFLGTVRNISSVSDGAIINSKIQDNTIQAAKLAYDYNQYRNIIINGDMSIAQRGTSTASVTATGYNSCDRWKNVLNNLGTFTVSQDTDVPTGQGFAKSLKMDCTTADASPASGDFNAIIQAVEGQNLQYLKKGTSSAESLTLSFWVKSNKTGTYTCEFRDVDNTRSISQTYTISSASTWEKKTITIDGDTTGAFDNDNAGSFQMWFWLGSGSDYNGGTLNTSWNASTDNQRVSSSNVNLADSTSNDFWITGVQLEAGTTASDFEFLPFDINQQRCLRYYYRLVQGTPTTFGMGLYYTSSFVFSVNSYPVRMRTTPSLDQVSGTNYYDFLRDGATDSVDDFVLNTAGRSNEIFYEIYNATDASGTAGQAGLFRGGNAASYIAFDAEL